MGSLTSHIADMEEDERWERHRKVQERKAECEAAWDRYLAGDGENGIDFPKVLEYARELDKEVQELRAEAKAAENLRQTLKRFLNVR